MRVSDWSFELRHNRRKPAFSKDRGFAIEKIQNFTYIEYRYDEILIFENIFEAGISIKNIAIAEENRYFGNISPS